MHWHVSADWDPTNRPQCTGTYQLIGILQTDRNALARIDWDPTNRPQCTGTYQLIGILQTDRNAFAMCYRLDNSSQRCAETITIYIYQKRILTYQIHPNSNADANFSKT